MIKDQNKNSLFFFAISVAIHCIALYFFLFFKFNINQFKSSEVMILEILPISEISNVKSAKVVKDDISGDIDKSRKVLNTVEKQNTNIVQEEQKKDVEKKIKEEDIKSLSNNKVDKIKSELIPEEAKNKIIKADKDTENVEKKNIVKKIDEKNDIDKPQVVEKKILQTKNQKKQDSKNENELESLLKNLETTSDGINPKGTQVFKQKNEKEQSAIGGYNENLALSISEIQLIKGMIERNWNVPIGIRDIKDLQLIFYIKLNINGTLEKVELLDKNCSDINFSLCEVLELSALRAIHQATPFSGLSPNRYEAWKEIKLILNPFGLNY